MWRRVNYIEEVIGMVSMTEMKKRKATYQMLAHPAVYYEHSGKSVTRRTREIANESIRKWFDKEEEKKVRAERAKATREKERGKPKTKLVKVECPKCRHAEVKKTQYKRSVNGKTVQVYKCPKCMALFTKLDAVVEKEKEEKKKIMRKCPACGGYHRFDKNGKTTLTKEGKPRMKYNCQHCKHEIVIEDNKMVKQTAAEIKVCKLEHEIKKLNEKIANYNSVNNELKKEIKMLKAENEKMKKEGIFPKGRPGEKAKTNGEKSIDRFTNIIVGKS